MGRRQTQNFTMIFSDEEKTALKKSFTKKKKKNT